MGVSFGSSPVRNNRSVEGGAEDITKRRKGERAHPLGLRVRKLRHRSRGLLRRLRL